MNTGNNHTNHCNCSFTKLYVLIYIRYSITKYLAGPEFAKQPLVRLKYKYKMHRWWICARGCGDYLQQVHLRIFHSSKHSLASDKRKTQACEQYRC